MNEAVALGAGPSAAGEADPLGGIDLRPILAALGPVGVAVLDPSGRVVEVNDAALELLGLERRHLMGHHPFSEPPPVDFLGAAEELLEQLAEVVTGRVPAADTRIVMSRHDGSLQQVTCSIRALSEGGHVQAVVVSLVDETARHDLDLVERTFSRSVQVLLRATDPEALVTQMCDTIVDAGYELAWIGEETVDGGLDPLAAAGATEHLDQGLSTRHEVDPHQRGPVAAALRTDEVQVVDDYEVDERVDPWRVWARTSGFGSTVAIPFALGHRRRGVLSIYSSRTHAFGPSIVPILLALTRDLEFGLRHLQTTDALARSEERFRFLAENTGDVVMLSRNGAIEWISPAVRTVLGWQPSELVGRSFDAISHPDEGDLRARARRDADTRTTYRGRVRRRDGTYAWVDARTRRFVGDDGEPTGVVISTFWDATNEVSAQEALAHAATHDALTGLANRALLLEELQLALAGGSRSGARTAVLLVDLDHFKYVNDSLGHTAGDALLGAAAERMIGAVREGDLVARPGGDEFVVVMRNIVETAEAVGVASRLLDALRPPVVVGDAELFTTASIGIAVSSRRGQDALDLLREADTAMYRAKDEGRDRLSVFNADLRASAVARLSVANELRVALERDELDVWFQPEVSLVDGSLVAVEALARWHHPSGETLPASRFIGTAEETGLILGIGRRVLLRACGQAARWSRARPDAPLTVRVNLSALQLGDAGLLADLDEVLAETGIDPDLLCLEITETAMLHETGTVRRNMAGIHDRGIDVAIDDFGTGYASLTYLRRYPVAVVKLDRSFVTDLADDEQDRQIAAGIVDLAHRLGIHVTAEGVEDQRQAEMLRALGCTTAQGYLYAPALSVEALESRYASRLTSG